MIRLLHIDDDQFDRDIIKANLESESNDIRITGAQSVQEAKNLLNKEDFDCVLSDYQMPNLSGLDLLHALRNEHSEVPFIFLTGQGNEEIAAEALRSGADDYFTKELGIAHYKRIIKSIEQLVNARKISQSHLAAEQKLISAEREKTSILDNLQELVVYHNTEMEILWTNRTAADSVNLTKDELAGKHCYEIWQKSDTICDKCPVVKALKTGEPQVAEITTSDGRVWLIRGNCVKDESGEIIGAIETVIEVTEQVIAERGLAAATERLELAFEGANLGLWDWHIEDNEIVINKISANTLGYSDREFTFKYDEFESIIHPGDFEPYQLGLKEHFEGKSKILALEYRLKSQDGNWEWFLVRGKVVERDKDDKPVRMTGINFHISDQKAAEESLREKKEQLKLSDQILEKIGNIVLVADEKGEILYASPSVKHVLGYDPEEVLGNAWWELTRPDETVRKKVKKEIAKMAWEEKSVPLKAYERKVQHKDGDDRWILWHDSRTGDGKIIGVGYDITERKEFEEKLKESRDQLKAHTQLLEEANSELDSFAHTVSHDLKSPLQRIAGYAQLLRDDYCQLVDGEGKKFLDSIVENSINMSDQITTLLKFSSVKKAEIVRMQIDLSSLSQTTIEKLQNDQPDREVQVNIESGMTLLADISLIAIVMENLIGNAWKYTSNREPAKISIGSMEQNGKTVFFVRDNGIGFDAHESEHLFKPFHRLKSTRDYEGTGIGLATVYRIIEHHGGEIWAEGKPGSGAIFYFTLD